MPRLLDHFTAVGVSLEAVAGGNLRARGRLTTELRADIQANKAAILAELLANERANGVAMYASSDARESICPVRPTLSA